MTAKNASAKASAGSDEDKSSEPKTPEEFRTEAWKVRAELSPKIPGLRKDAFAIDGYYSKPTSGKKRRAEHAGPPGDEYSAVGLSSRKDMPQPSGDDPAAVVDWARKTLAWSHELGVQLAESSTKVDYGDHDWVIQFVMITTQAAGYLLHATERLLLEPTPAATPSKAQHPGASPPPVPSKSSESSSPAKFAIAGGDPPSLVSLPSDGNGASVPDVELSLAAYTCVMAARNHVVAAEQAVQNLRKNISDVEIEWLGGLLGASVFLYTFFHPTWGVYRPWFPTGIWEVIWWSLFGAVAASYIRVNADTETDTFDTRHPFAYVYRIVTAPLVAIVIIYLWTVVGVSLSSSSAASPLTLGTGTLANLATLVVLSFLLGFFSKEALDILKHAWQGIVSQSGGSDKGTSS